MFWRRTSQKERLLAFLRQAPLREVEIWMKRRLKGDDSRFVLPPAGQPHFFIVKTYRAAEEAIRGNLEFAAVNLLRQVAIDSREWTDEYLEELFLLADPIFLYSKRQAEIIDSLLTVIKTASSDPLGARLACPAAQALLTLDYRAHPRLWMDMFERCGEIFSPCAVEGLGRIGLQTLQEWLRSKLPHARLERDFINLIPFFVEREGAPAVSKLLSSLGEELSAASRDEIERDAEASGFRVVWSGAPSAARLSEHLAALLAIVLGSETSLSWEAELARTTYRDVLRDLDSLLDASEMMGAEGPPSEKLGHYYAQFIAYGLETRDLASTTYREMVGRAPLPELYEVTEFALASGTLTLAEVREVLNGKCQGGEAESILSSIEREVRRKKSEGAPAQLPEETRQSLQRYRRTLMGAERELAEALLAQDMEIPRDAAVWVTEMAGAEQ